MTFSVKLRPCNGLMAKVVVVRSFIHFFALSFVRSFVHSLIVSLVILFCIYIFTFIYISLFISNFQFADNKYQLRKVNIFFHSKNPVAFQKLLTESLSGHQTFISGSNSLVTCSKGLDC